MNRTLRISIVQAATLWHDAAGNRALYEGLLRPLAGSTDLVVLPETFTSGFSNEAAQDAETMDGPTLAWMAGLARELGAVVTGSLAIRDGEARVNRLVWMRPDGRLKHYDKRHLFRYAGEHTRYRAGRERLLVELGAWRVFPFICYDLRFPVFLRNRVQSGILEYDLAVCVANWPASRHHAWHTLLRARAIENLACVVGVNRTGTDGNALEYRGGSAVIDPSGQALIECGAQPQVATCALDRDALDAHRERFPFHLDADAFDLR